MTRPPKPTPRGLEMLRYLYGGGARAFGADNPPQTYRVLEALERRKFARCTRRVFWQITPAGRRAVERAGGGR